MPFPPDDGGSIAIYNTTIGLIENGISVHLLALNPSRERVDEATLPTEFKEITNFQSVSVDTHIKPLKALLNLFETQSYFIKRFYSSDFREKLVDILRQEKYDIIQLEHLYMCIYIDTIRKYSPAKIVLRPQNVEYEVWKSYLKNLSNPFKKIFLQVAVSRLKNFETSVVSKVDGIAAITPKDAFVFRKFVKGIPVIDVPVSFNYQLLENYDFEKQYENFPIVYHFGSMNWRPNEEAVSWFLKKVYPELKKTIPEIKVHLAGKKMQPRFLNQSDDNLIVEGRVANALDYQEDKAIMIVPLISGSGIRAKIVEGMALGKTIITTSTGAQGMRCTPENELLIANTPNEFMNQIKRCIESEAFCRKIGNSAREFAIKNFHYKLCAKEMIGFYKSLIK